MVRGWIIFSCLILGVVFRVYQFDKTHTISFPFSERTLDRHSWVYFFMEHIIYLGLALCIIIQDSTPKFLLWLFFAILVLDLFHYVLFFRDEGPGWNLIKVIIYGIPLLFIELKRLWHQFKY